MGYKGFCQRMNDFSKRERNALEAMRKLIQTKVLIEASGLQVGIVSVGGTSTHMIVSNSPNNRFTAHACDRGGRACRHLVRSYFGTAVCQQSDDVFWRGRELVCRR